MKENFDNECICNALSNCFVLSKNLWTLLLLSKKPVDVVASI